MSKSESLVSHAPGAGSVLLTAAQMQTAERAAIAAGKATGDGLMERAGRGVVDAILGQWPELAIAPRRAVILCGPGNNGGDGFVIARLLRERGWSVVSYLLGVPDRLPPDARINHDRWVAMGGRVTALEALSVEGLAPPDVAPDVIVDALFGTGIARPLGRDIDAALAPIRETVAETGARVVAVDLPSGLCSDSGRPLGAPLAADLTVTFHAVKLGHVLDQGPAWCGALVLVDLGLDPHVKGPGQVARLAAPSGELLTKRGGHKYDHGHLLVLTGGAGKTGAARLAARSALRVGTGLVTLGVHPGAVHEVACHITAEMMVPVGDRQALEGVLADDRIRAVCLGPGLGVNARGAALVAAALADGRPLLLDADALTLIARDHALFSMLHEHCLLTPHAGEFARLFPDMAEPLAHAADRGPAFSKAEAARRAAARAGCSILLKGVDTVIAGPEGQCAINAASYGRAAPWLATAGAGDVLSGIAAGLLARGGAPFVTGETAAWLHLEAARAFGPGLIATDMEAVLPTVLRAGAEQGPGAREP